jgi:polyhydroxyalkanoate synthesis regulator phasin
MSQEFYDCIAEWADRCHALSKENEALQRELEKQILYANDEVDKHIKLRSEFLKQNLELTQTKQERDELKRQVEELKKGVHGARP